MSPAVLLALLLGAFLVLLVTQWVRIEVTALGTIAALAMTGVLTTEEALSGFSNPALVTIVAMLVLSAGIERSGAMDVLASSIARVGARGESLLLLFLLAPIASMSAFLNNTPVVALMIPTTLALSRKTGIQPSRVLMPVSFISILGGTCTLIGTSTNILVDSLHRQHGGEGFGMFEFSGLGLLYLLVGGLYVVLLGPKLLPKRAGLSELLPAAGEGEFVTVITIPKDSSLAGKDLAAALRGADEVKVLEVVRDETPHMRPPKEFVLREGDHLLLVGSARAIHGLIERKGVEAGQAQEDDRVVPISRVDLRIAECVVTPSSSFRYKRVQELGLSRRFGVQVLALRRLGRQHQYNLGSLRIHSGDVLLMQGEPRSLRSMQEDGDVLLVEGAERTLTKPKKAPLAIGILVAVVALASMGAAPIAALGLAGAGAMLLFRCLDVGDATRAVDATVLLLVAASIPLGLAMERVGLADQAAHVITGVGDAGVFVLVGVVYLVTSLLTAVISNNAAAVVLVPIALSAAAQLGIDPKPLLVAIAFGASASFATPIGYQTNTLVMGPGGYEFRDYMRFGGPLTVLMWLTATALIPLFWPA